MSALAQLGWLWLAAALAMTLGWLWQRRHRNAGIVDVIWASGVGAGAVWMAAGGAGAAAPRTVLALLGGLWGLRLASHLWRRVGGEEEDGRYRALRAHWQGHQGKFFLVFQFQALLIVLVALPFLAVAGNGTTSWPWIAAGAAVWLAAVAGETAADRQLARFRSAPGNRGTTCRRGLWRYSRHPNYFFEWLHWFAYVCLAAGAPLWWLAWSGPLLMYLFVRYLSGIPFTERQALRSRGEDYRRYQRDTPMFFPWFPKAGDDAGRTRRAS